MFNLFRLEVLPQEIEEGLFFIICVSHKNLPMGLYVKFRIIETQ